MDLLTKLKSFDAYPKLNEEFKVRTLGGAIVSICAIVVILILFISELSLYFHVERVDHLYVDVSRGEKLRINFDVTFPHIPCSLLSLDAMDVSGSHQLGIDHHIKKRPLNAAGQAIGEEMTLKLGEQLSETDVKQMKQSAARAESGAIEDITKDPQYCGPCYGAELTPGQCCRTCDDVKAAYEIRNWAVPPLVTIEQCVAQGQTVDPSQTELTEHQGCQMHGYLEVNKVAGNFHFAPGKSYQRQNVHYHDLAQFQSVRFNVSHRIHHLSFGESYPGQVNPLDASSKDQPALDRGPNDSLPEPSDSGGMFMYYCKIVPTTYSYLHSFSQLVTNQFSVTEHYRLTSARDGQGLPGVFFFYELSPIMVSISERRMGLLHFVTQLCAILGGVFTVAGMIDRLVYSSLKSFEKKLTLNKIS